MSLVGVGGQPLMVNSDNQLGVTKILLGQYVQDDVGTQWHVIQEVRHWESPNIIRLVLKEYCIRDARVAICRDNGTEFACAGSPATCILSILKPAIS